MVEAHTPSAETARTDTRGGVFLPCLQWTADPGIVERAYEHLIGRQLRLDALIKEATHEDTYASWYLMLEASVEQLDMDIDRLHEWLLDHVPTVVDRRVE